MKRFITKRHSLFLLALAAVILVSGCKKREDTFEFQGIVRGSCQCSGVSTSITDIDFGYIIELSTPDSIGKDYYYVDEHQHTILLHNCVRIYKTHARLYDGDAVSGTMYLDEKYSAAYCTWHPKDGLPEGVCYTLD